MILVRSSWKLTPIYGKANRKAKLSKPKTLNTDAITKYVDWPSVTVHLSQTTLVLAPLLKGHLLLRPL
jgi:hypothetical protein